MPPARSRSLGEGEPRSPTKPTKRRPSHPLRAARPRCWVIIRQRLRPRRENRHRPAFRPLHRTPTVPRGLFCGFRLRRITVDRKCVERRIGSGREAASGDGDAANGGGVRGDGGPTVACRGRRAALACSGQSPLRRAGPAVNAKSEASSSHSQRLAVVYFTPKACLGKTGNASVN